MDGRRTKRVICPRCKYKVEISERFYPPADWFCRECKRELGPIPWDLGSVNYKNENQQGEEWEIEEDSMTGSCVGEPTK